MKNTPSSIIVTIQRKDHEIASNQESRVDDALTGAKMTARRYIHGCNAGHSLDGMTFKRRRRCTNDILADESPQQLKYIDIGGIVSK